MNIEGVKNAIILMVGPPCVGKTTFARNELKLYVRLNKEEYSDDSSKLMKALDKLMLSETPIVLIGENGTKEERKVFIDLAKRHEYTVFVWELVLPENELEKRINDRYVEPLYWINRMKSFYNTYELPDAVEEGIHTIIRKLGDDSVPFVTLES